MSAHPTSSPRTRPSRSCSKPALSTSCPCKKHRPISISLPCCVTKLVPYVYTLDPDVMTMMTRKMLRRRKWCRVWRAISRHKRRTADRGEVGALRRWSYVSAVDRWRVSQRSLDQSAFPIASFHHIHLARRLQGYWWVTVDGRGYTGGAGLWVITLGRTHLRHLFNVQVRSQWEIAASPMKKQTFLNTLRQSSALGYHFPSSQWEDRLPSSQSACMPHSSCC